jgi:hypothetical protein
MNPPESNFASDWDVALRKWQSPGNGRVMSFHDWMEDWMAKPLWARYGPWGQLGTEISYLEIGWER